MIELGTSCPNPAALAPGSNTKLVPKRVPTAGTPTGSLEENAVVAAGLLTVNDPAVTALTTNVPLVKEGPVDPVIAMVSPSTTVTAGTVAEV
jgi:hypothetical protein